MNSWDRFQGAIKIIWMIYFETQSLPISMFKSGSRYSNPFAQKISFHTRIKSSDAVDLPFEIAPESKQENYQDDEEIITSDSFGALSDDFEGAVENLVTLINEDENRLDTLGSPQKVEAFHLQKFYKTYTFWVAKRKVSELISLE